MNGLEAQISSICRFQRKERDLKLLAQYRHPRFSCLKMAKVREFHHYFLSILCFMECGLRSNCLRKTDRPCLYDLSYKQTGLHTDAISRILKRKNRLHPTLYDHSEPGKLTKKNLRGYGRNRIRSSLFIFTIRKCIKILPTSTGQKKAV